MIRPGSFNLGLQLRFLAEWTRPPNELEMQPNELELQPNGLGSLPNGLTAAPNELENLPNELESRRMDSRNLQKLLAEWTRLKKNRHNSVSKVDEKIKEFCNFAFVA